MPQLEQLNLNVNFIEQLPNAPPLSREDMATVEKYGLKIAPSGLHKLRLDFNMGLRTLPAAWFEEDAGAEPRTPLHVPMQFGKATSGSCGPSEDVTDAEQRASLAGGQHSFFDEVQHFRR